MNDENRDIWKEVLDGVCEIKSGEGKRYTLDMPEIVSTRHKLGFSQLKFSEMLGISKRTLQDWEQGRRKPSGSARSLLILAEKKPEVLIEVFG
jgi:putative transcriptional regulator